MAMAKVQELDYPSTVKCLFLADPPVIATHRVNAISSELELCRRFLAGTCPNGDKCKYSHKGTSAVPKQDSRAKTPYPRNGRPSAPSLKTPIVVSKDH